MRLTTYDAYENQFKNNKQNKNKINKTIQKSNLAESGPKIPVYIWFLDSAESTEKKC